MNQLIELDQEAMEKLAALFVACNHQVADLPHVYVAHPQDYPDGNIIGLVEVLNSMFANESERIVAVFDNRQRLLSFHITSDLPDITGEVTTLISALG